MAGPFNFTGNNIQDTYQRIVQTDGTNFFDGTGSAVTFGSPFTAEGISGSFTEASSSFSTRVTTLETAGSSGDAFPFTGSAEITGSLQVIGPLTITGSQLITDDITSSGTLRAKVKSFDIVHPTKPGKRLVYGVMEGPEHGVYCRGRSQELKVKLPPEWSKLVVPSTITVQITSAGKFQPIYFEKFISNWLYFGCDSKEIKEFDFFWEIKGARADVPKLKTTQ
jgi:hypothetical protein